MLWVGNLNAQCDLIEVHDVAADLALLAAAPRLPARFTCNVASGM